MDFRGVVAVLAAATSIVTGVSPAAFADDDPANGPAKDAKYEVLDYEFDPLTNDDALVTDEMETQAPLGGNCTYEPVVTGPNATPPSPSFQLLYVVPYDQAATNALDRPMTCPDGNLVYSAIARASRNLATWQDRRGAGLHYRTLNGSYTHDYTGASIVTRSVRRFRSQFTRAQWDSWPLKASDGSSPRLAQLAAELADMGYDVSNTRYAVVLHTSAQQRSCTETATSYKCSYYVGVASTPGKYGLTTRAYPPYQVYQSEKAIRYGCNTYDGDAFLGHETTHQVGGQHVSTTSGYDLMKASKASNVSFGTSPYLTWDAEKDDYHPTVYGSVYVTRESLPGSYYSC